jgi:hypothetical protein
MLAPNEYIMFLNLYLFPFNTCLCISVHYTNPFLWLAVTQYIVKEDALCVMCVEARVISLSSQNKLVFPWFLIILPPHKSNRRRVFLVN